MDSNNLNHQIYNNNNQNYDLNDSTDSDYDTDSDNEDINLINQYINTSINIDLDLINNEKDREEYQKIKKSITNNNFNLSGSGKIYDSQNIKGIQKKVFLSPTVDSILYLKEHGDNIDVNGNTIDVNSDTIERTSSENTDATNESTNESDNKSTNDNPESEYDESSASSSYVLSSKETFSDRLEKSNKEKIKELCFSAFYTSTNFTTKMCGLCMLSEEQYPDDEINQSIIPCINHINPHHCYGSIWYHPKYIDRFQYTIALAEIDLGLIMKHNLQNITMKVVRSSGEVQEINFEADNPLMINKNYGFCYRAYLDEYKGMYKDMTLQNINIEEKTKIGIIESNPDIFTEDFVFKIGIKKNQNYWLIDDEREEWKQKIITNFAKFVPELKFEFYEFDNYEI